VLAHELGHVLGLEHGTSELMDEVIQPGRRELPSLALDSQPSAVARATGGVPAMHSVDPITPILGHVDLVDVPRSVRGAAIVLDAVVAQSVVERATHVVSAATPTGDGGPSPMSPATLWALLIGLGLALSALRRWRLLCAPRR
jgi:hypothetical protein